MNFHRVINKLTLATLRFHLTAVYSILLFRTNPKVNVIETYLTRIIQQPYVYSALLTHVHDFGKLYEYYYYVCASDATAADTGIHWTHAQFEIVIFCSVENNIFRFWFFFFFFRSICFAREFDRNQLVIYGRGFFNLTAAAVAAKPPLLSFQMAAIAP